jgi:hypothetical protein
MNRKYLVLFILFLLVTSSKPVYPQQTAHDGGNEPLASSATATAHKKVNEVVARPSVLERFRRIRLKRTPGNLIALFDQEPVMGFRQEPKVAFSDGKTVINVKFVSEPGWRNTGGVAVKKGQLLLIEKDPDVTNTWNIVLKPEKGADDVLLSVPMKDGVMIFPVAAAPARHPLLTSPIEGEGSKLATGNCKLK